MNTPETINIEKYANALNNLVGMDIGYLGESDEDVNTIVELIRAAKALENRVKELEHNLKMSEHLLKGAHERIEQLDELCGDLQKLKYEIFDELDNIVRDYNRYEIGERGMFARIAELKKKHVEAANE